MELSLSRQRTIGLLWALLAAAGYSLLPIFGRQLYVVSDLQATDIVIWRFIFATPAIWLFIAVQRRGNNGFAKGKTQLPRVRLFLLGTLYAAAALAAFGALQFIEASKQVVLFHTYPAMVAFIGIFIGQRLVPTEWLALSIAVIGVFFTVPDFSISGAESPGVLLALFNALIVAVYFLAIEYIMRGVTAVSRASAWVITGTLVNLLLLGLFTGVQIPQNPATWALLFGLAIFSTALPIFFVNIGIQMIGASRTAIISNAEPLLTILLAMLLLGERIQGIQWVGTFLIITGVIILEMPAARKTTT